MVPHGRSTIIKCQCNLVGIFIYVLVYCFGGWTAQLSSQVSKYFSNRFIIVKVTFYIKQIKI